MCLPDAGRVLEEDLDGLIDYVVPADNRVIGDHAVLHGVPDDMETDLIEGGLRGHHLGQDVVALLIGLDHRLKPSNLPFESAETVDDLLALSLVSYQATRFRYV